MWVGAYSRWALIRGWALNRINMVCVAGITVTAGFEPIFSVRDAHV